MTEYSNVLTLVGLHEIYLVIANKKSLELIAKRINSKTDHKNIWKSDQTNTYIIAISTQKGPLQKYIFMRLLKVPISPLY